jgi:hypothetical protein
MHKKHFRLFTLQPHLLTCTFDAVSTLAEDKAYLGCLIFCAWFLPLATISGCYLRVG